MRKLEGQNQSLMTTQLAILGLAPAGDEAALEGERRRMAVVRLRPLELGASAADGADAAARRRPVADVARSRGARWPRPGLFPPALAAGWRPLLLPTLTLAAGVAATLLVAPWKGLVEPAPGLRAKGESKVWIYWERAGTSAPWATGTGLKSGDRIRAEVLAAEAGTAYWTVLGTGGAVLLEPGETARAALSLAAGARRAFDGSFKLVGAAEAERLAVVVCRAGASRPDFPAAGRPFDLTALPAGCGAETFQLR